MKKDKIFLNRPIQNEEEDWIGISTYVDVLDGAVEAGAKIIAVTSDFGTGKSSLISLYQKKYRNKKKKILNINLWGTYDHQTNGQELLPIELHKSFLYQTVNQLYPPIWGKGSYISKRLSKDYGIISISGRNLIQAILTIVAIVLGLSGFFALKFREVIAVFWGKSEAYVSNIITFLFLAAFIVLVVVLSCSEFIFSSKKSEGQRNLDENILIDLFRREVLKKGRNNHYIFVIEDLDRTDSKETVLMFLRELRKYYISEGSKNQVTFIVCIKPEATLTDQEDDSREYKKIFDYILNLQKINIDNYDAILKGLLSEKRLWLEELGLINESKKQNDEMQIEGMQWMIRGRDIDIREIKNRLNMALSLYENLRHRFPEEGKQKVITFEKCAVATYLRSEYEKEVYKLQDKDLENLISQYVVYGMSEADMTEGEYCPQSWKNFNQEFKGEVWRLVESKLIDVNFRVFFYNYPSESNLYDLGEMIVYNSIVYQEEPVDSQEYKQYLNGIADRVIVDAFKKVELLGINVPKFVFEYDRLFFVLANFYEDNLCRFIGTLRFNEKTFQEDCALVLSCVRQRTGAYDREKLIEKIAEKLNTMLGNSSSVIEVREKICKEIPKQVLHYKVLFQENNPFISIEEVKALEDLDKILEVTNYAVMKASAESPKEIHHLIVQKDDWKPSYTEFYEKMISIQGMTAWKQDINEICVHLGKIPDGFVQIYEQEILDRNVNISEYVELINDVAVVKDRDIDILVKNQWILGVKKEVCNLLYARNELLLFVCNESLLSEPEIDFGEERIRQVVKEEADWIAENALDSFERIRKLILAKHGLIEDYKELFCPPYVHLSADELALIENCTDALSIIENRSMTMKSGEDVVNYFNQKNRKTTETYELVRYIARQNKLVAERMFYKMNLSKLPYHRMAKARIREINDLFYDLFEMEDKPEEKVKFLSFVGVSYEKMEKNLYEDLNSDEELRDKYVGYANKLDTVGKSTIDNIVGLSTVLTYSKAINDKLYSLGYYTQYVSSKTSLEKGFEVEEERRDILWPIYVKMFHSPFRQRIRGLMSANEDFLQELITEKEYEKAGDALGHYKVALQTNALLAYVFEQLSDEKLCEYLQGVCGFKDRNAAHFCLELLKERQAVAAKVQVYQNLHGKFVEPGLEGWLTKIWKKAKKGQN